VSAVNAKSMLKAAEKVPEKARYPVVDFHNHLFAVAAAEELLQVMGSSRGAGV